jgi:membrane protein implicated in regulation of membrane protease activity
MTGEEGYEMNRPASLVAAILFWLIALAQLLRVILRVEVIAGGVTIPLWISFVAFVILAGLGIWLWREGLEPRKDYP